MQFRKCQDSPVNAIGPRAAGPRGSRRWGRVLVCLTAVATLAGATHPGQNTAGGKPIRDEMPPLPSRMPGANDQMRMREERTKTQNFEAANNERKRQIAEDSAKLLKLATELKAEVDKTTKDMLSLTVIRKADEIERLAHNVKDKMKLTVGAN